MKISELYKNRLVTGITESSFHGMIPSFHAVFVLRQRDKSAKVIDYNNQVLRVREYLIFLGIIGVR